MSIHCQYDEYEIHVYTWYTYRYTYFTGPNIPLVEYTHYYVYANLITFTWFIALFLSWFSLDLSLMPASSFNPKTLFIAVLSPKMPYIYTNSSNCLLFRFSTFSYTAAFEFSLLQQYANTYTFVFHRHHCYFSELSNMEEKYRSTLQPTFF